MTRTQLWLGLEGQGGPWEGICKLSNPQKSNLRMLTYLYLEERFMANVFTLRLHLYETVASPSAPTHLHNTWICNHMFLTFILHFPVYM